MKVTVYDLTVLDAIAGAPPRAWRISTDEGVFWLLQDGATARLLSLPLPGVPAMGGAMTRYDVPASGAALALEAETAAASRWVRQGSAGRGHDVAPVGDAR